MQTPINTRLPRPVKLLIKQTNKYTYLSHSKVIDAEDLRMCQATRQKLIEQLVHCFPKLHLQIVQAIPYNTVDNHYFHKFIEAHQLNLTGDQLEAILDELEEVKFFEIGWAFEYPNHPMYCHWHLSDLAVELWQLQHPQKFLFNPPRYPWTPEQRIKLMDDYELMKQHGNALIASPCR